MSYWGDDVSMDHETRRKFLHMSGVLFAPALVLIYENLGLTLAASALLLLVVLTYAFSEAYRRGSKPPVVSIFIDLMEREEAKKLDPGKGVKMFFWGCLASLLLFGPVDIRIVSTAIVVVALGDSASTLIGLRYGKHKINYNEKKSWEGALAGFLLAFAGAALQVDVPIAFVGALAGMLVESLPLRLDDNLTVPLGSSTAIYFGFYF